MQTMRLERSGKITGVGRFEMSIPTSAALYVNARPWLMERGDQQFSRNSCTKMVARLAIIVSSSSLDNVIL
jgi:hypothetical protein